MNYLLKRYLCVLLITLLLFASVQSVFAGLLSESGDHDHVMDVMDHAVMVHDHAAIMGRHAGDSTIDSTIYSISVSVDAAQLSDDGRHCDILSGSTMLCGNCNFCVHCVACIPDLHVENDGNKVINNFFISASHFYFDLPTKDRPPRNA